MLGKFRGKMGGMVYRVDPEAGQVVSEYNPSPRNPRTLAQVDQRTKMNLAGLMSKVTPSTVLVGLSPMGRKARSMFVSNILKKCAVVRPGSEPGSRTTSIIYENVVLSEGEVVPMSGTVSLDENTNVLSVSIPKPTVGATLAGVQIVIYASNEQGYMLCVEKAATIPASSTPITVSETFPMEYGTFVVYAIPVIERTTGVSVAWAEYVTDGNGNFHLSIMRNLAANEALGQSVMIGSARVV